MHIIAAFLISAVLVYISIPVIVKISAMKKLVDKPNERKVNDVPIPNLGGVALFLGITIGTLLSIDKIEVADFRYIFASMTLLFFLGIKDDILVLSATTKFVTQFFATGILIVLGGIRLTSLHGIFGIEEIGYVESVVLSFLVIIGIINAMNLIDGIDGLAGGLSLMITSIFGVFFIGYGQTAYAILAFAAAGSVMPFLYFNLFGKTNKIFMGDTGSLILGLLISVMVIRYNEFAIGTGHGAASPAISLSILMFPVLDVFRVMLVRIRHRKSPFKPDKNHIHHKCLDLKFSHLASSLILILFNFAVVVLIFLLRALNIHILLALLLVLYLLFYFVLVLLQNRKTKEAPLPLHREG
ncbi:MraY family glycosyltransferase [Microbacter margulisiae]|nr:MraY family glycosyltransferase [Microbacter margulisiae]